MMLHDFGHGAIALFYREAKFRMRNSYPKNSVKWKFWDNKLRGMILNDKIHEEPI